MATETLKKGSMPVRAASAKACVTRKNTKKKDGVWGLITALLRGLAASLIATLLGIVVFALLIQWLSPSNGVLSVMNQALKLIAIGVGVWFAVGRGGESGLLRGAVVGLLYMLIGVILYALLSGLRLPVSAYLADLGMGVAAGGLFGLISSNLSSK